MCHIRRYHTLLIPICRKREENGTNKTTGTGKTDVSYTIRVNKETFASIVERMKQGWKGKLLSQAGKMTLIKSVTAAIQQDLMSCFRLPKHILSGPSFSLFSLYHQKRTPMNLLFPQERALRTKAKGSGFFRGTVGNGLIKITRVQLIRQAIRKFLPVILTYQFVMRAPLSLKGEQRTIPCNHEFLKQELGPVYYKQIVQVTPYGKYINVTS